VKYSRLAADLVPAREPVLLWFDLDDGPVMGQGLVVPHDLGTVDVIVTGTDRDGASLPISVLAQDVDTVVIGAVPGLHRIDVIS
jgi:hypothetical protein